MHARREVASKFKDEFVTDDLFGGIGSAVRNGANTVGAVFDWDEYQEANDMNFDPEELTETPTMVTGRTVEGDGETLELNIFSSGGNRAYFNEKYIEQASEVLGYNIRANLDRVRLHESKDAMLIAESDGFDIIIAPRIPPSEFRDE